MGGQNVPGFLDQFVIGFLLAVLYPVGKIFAIKNTGLPVLLTEKIKGVPFLQKVASRSDLLDNIQRQVLAVNFKTAHIALDHADGLVGKYNHFGRGHKTLAQITAIVNQIGAVKGGI